MKISGLILAAGDSSRLGQPKQLLNINGRTLLQHVEQQLYPLCDDLLVVLGHAHERMGRQLHQARTLINSEWQKGMGHSLKTGFKELSSSSDAILVALSDQPFIPTQHYQQLITCARQNTGHLISSQYAGHRGVPAAIGEDYFTAVQALSDEHGARSLLRQNLPNHISFPCAEAASDIDTQSQADALNAINTKD